MSCLNPRVPIRITKSQHYPVATHPHLRCGSPTGPTRTPTTSMPHSCVFPSSPQNLSAPPQPLSAPPLHSPSPTPSLDEYLGPERTSRRRVRKTAA
ncbi:hypothetical protein L207DRAFT_184015 [Hyaloscypha variabilis F]|uniref:Uncharacterized protein n=1 Tax=Hyaloscypha variabilis (strain UAMH 11265 / GT02V1 / F) TaxID=1149755 RepID=A0A2J6R0S7_HYAVF|nr:hypothetical protein L207DRAFT_184015 [Hyaloscypha variabilis F]